MMSSIGIIDYGMSNSFSVLSMINRLGKNVKILNFKRNKYNEKIILPGVGVLITLFLTLKNLVGMII